jgi:hypothetical protein
MKIIIVMVSGATHRSVDYTEEQINRMAEGLTNFRDAKSIAIDVPVNESGSEIRKIWINPGNVEHIYMRD